MFHFQMRFLIFAWKIESIWKLGDYLLHPTFYVLFAPMNCPRIMISFTQNILLWNFPSFAHIFFLFILVYSLKVNNFFFCFSFDSTHTDTCSCDKDVNALDCSSIQIKAILFELRSNLKKNIQSTSLFGAIASLFKIILLSNGEKWWAEEIKFLK